jgi:thioredoxin-like negative regulator of GroEL
VSAGETRSVFDVIPGVSVDPSTLVTAFVFSSAFCQPCRATRALLAEVATLVPGFTFVEVDAEAHLDVVREMGISSTPTVVFVDAEGAEFARASGQPRKADLIATIAPKV